jgi:Putative auto-transporter adhesin, head GIN domain
VGTITRRSFLGGGAVALGLGLSGCVGPFWGSGRAGVEDRAVSGFDAVGVGGGAQLVLRQTGRESLTIETDDNLLPLVEAGVRGGRLSLGWRPGTSVSSRHRLRFEVSARELNAIAASGGAEAEATGIDTPSLRVDVSGGGQVRAEGRADRQEVTASGGGGYDGAGLHGRSARVRASGGGWAIVDVAEELEASASGGGWVEYAGEPRVRQETSGGGSVRRR